MRISIRMEKYRKMMTLPHLKKAMEMKKSQKGERKAMAIQSLTI